MKLEKVTCAFLIVILIIAFTAFTMPFSLALLGTKIYVNPPLIIDKGISPSPPYYLSTTSLTGFGTNYRKLVTTTGAADTTTSVKNAKSTGYFFFDPFTTGSTGTGTPSTTVLKGYGWRSDGVYGKTIPSGTWQFNLTLTSSSATGTGHIEIWVYKCTTIGGSVSNLFSIDATETNVLATTTATKYTFTYTASSAYDLTSYVLVIEYWLHVTTAGGSSTGNVQLTAVSDASYVKVPALTIDIMVADVTDLFSWQVTIYYNATMLNVIGVSLPPGHVFADWEASNLIVVPVPIIDNTAGYVQWGVSLLTPDITYTGPGGVLFRITFSVLNRGYTPIHFSSPYGEDTLLQDTTFPYLIPASTEDGFFSNKLFHYGTLFAFSKAYGSKPGDANWNSSCSFNWDDKIDISDLFLLGKNY